MRFRTAQISGTQEIRQKIGHLGTWAAVQYGLGIFITISPGERHNYLAIRLCRYRGGDPFIACDTENARAQRPYAQIDAPSLEPDAGARFHFEIPGYDLRRIMQAQDPLSAVNAFMVQVITILATCLGARMCPDCPRCAESSNPCQDSFGSVAEVMGGFAGRTDAIFGAKECQKSNGSLHLHMFVFIQRLHQYCNLAEIAQRLEQALVNAEDLKDYINNICCTTYPDPERFEAEKPKLEKNFPRYAEWQEYDAAEGPLRCGDCMLGQIPAFVRQDSHAAPKASLVDLFPSTEDNALDRGTTLIAREEAMRQEGQDYKVKFERSQQFFQSRCQHHIHKWDPKTKKTADPTSMPVHIETAGMQT